MRRDFFYLVLNGFDITRNNLDILPKYYEKLYGIPSSLGNSRSSESLISRYAVWRVLPDGLIPVWIRSVMRTFDSVGVCTVWFISTVELLINAQWITCL